MIKDDRLSMCSHLTEINHEFVVDLWSKYVVVAIVSEKIDY